MNLETHFPPHRRLGAWPSVLRLSLASTRCVIRSAVSNVLAIVMLASVLIPPDTVLCLRPRNHCHLEVVVGASCSDQMEPQRPSRRLPDGCPKGSKDFRVSADSHRTDYTLFIVAPVRVRPLWSMTCTCEYRLW
jgi:hypothetical protein